MANDWTEVYKAPWAYTQDQILQIGQSLGVPIPEIQGVIQAGYKANYARAQADAAAAARAQTPSPRQPESAALAQMQQIDPASEALRAGLGQSYLANLGGGPPAPQFGGMPQFGLDLSRGAGAPSAGDIQSYLNLYKQIDPSGYAQRAGMGAQLQGQIGQAGQYVGRAQDILGQTGQYVGQAQGYYGQTKAMADQATAYVQRVTGQTPGSPQEALAQYQKLDPRGYAQMNQLAGAFGGQLTQAQQQAALGTQLDPGTLREVEQGTRAAQIARGNVYGTPQLVAETMARGSAGEARQQQRFTNLAQMNQAMQGYLQSGATPGAIGNTLYGQRLGQLQSAMGAQQGAYGVQQGGLGALGSAYGTQQAALGGVSNALATQQGALGGLQNWMASGQTIGDIANNLYNQGYNRYLQGYGAQANAALQGYGAQMQGWQAQQQARLQSQGAALGYLGSGQTPYQAGASYLNMAQQNAAQAAQGGPQYNPASLGQQYTGAGASSFPQYGLDMSQLAGNWYNNINQANLQAYGLQQAYGQRSGGGSGMGAATGALGGAASGALAGSAAGPWGTVIGGLGGALAGGLSGYSR
jgi:hypothetical protein